MKKHFNLLIDSQHLKWTLLLLFVSIVLIIAGSLIGISDNFPGISMVFFGAVLLYFSVFHPWRKPFKFMVLAGICSGAIFVLLIGVYVYASIFLKPGSQHAVNSGGDFLEGFVLLSVFFVLAPGIVAGLAGAALRYIRHED